MLSKNHVNPDPHAYAYLELKNEEILHELEPGLRGRAEFSVIIS